MLTGIEKQGFSLDAQIASKDDGFEAPVRSLEPHDWLLANDNSKPFQPRSLVADQLRWPMGAQHQVAGPLMKQASQTRAFLPATEYRDRRIAMLPPIAVGAHMHTATK